MQPGDRFLEEVAGGVDPIELREAADRAAALLVRGARDSDDPAVAERLLHLADTEGIETIAEVWSGSPADSLAGCLWRLFVLRSWVYADPESAAVARSVVWHALDALAPRRRAVVVMYELEGAPVDRIAALLGVSQVTVRWHLSMGRRQLARVIRGQETKS